MGEPLTPLQNPFGPPVSIRTMKPSMKMYSQWGPQISGDMGANRSQSHKVGTTVSKCLGPPLILIAYYITQTIGLEGAEQKVHGLSV